MDDCIDSLGDAQIFTTLDANCGYWQLRIDPADRDKTSFVSHGGSYRYLRMPFGLRNARDMFHRCLDIILSGVRWKSCLVYLDDVIVQSNKLEDHIKHVDEVLTLLEEAGISLKLRKFEFFQRQVKYLGQVFLPNKLTIAKDATKGIHDATFPQDITQLRSYLGACNVYRRFIQKFATIAHPLNEMLRKDAQPDFDNSAEDQVRAFETLKCRLMEPPVLELPQRNRPFMIETETSAYQVGAVLLQQQNDENPKT